MNTRKRPVIIACLLIISVGNYIAKNYSDDIRPIQFVMIFVIGALSAMLIRELIGFIRNARNDK